MGIDSIGKGSPPLESFQPPEGSALRPKDTGRTFEASRPVEVGGSVPTSAVTPLERFRCGEVDLQGYLDAKVHEATAHLTGLPPADLEAIQSALRDRLSSDPALVEVVRSVGGAHDGP